MNILRLRWLCNDTIELVGSNELAFTFVPRGKDFSRRGAAQNARMDESRKFDVWDMPAEY